MIWIGVGALLLVMITVSACNTPTPTAVPSPRPPVIPVPSGARLVDVEPIAAYDTKMYVYELTDDWHEADVALYYFEAADRLGWRFLDMETDYDTVIRAIRTTWTWTDKDGQWLITIGWDGELFYGVAPLE